MILKPWLFQTAVYLETGYRPIISASPLDYLDAYKAFRDSFTPKKKNEMKKNKTPFTNLEVTFKIHLAQKYEGAYDASEVD